MTGFFDIRYFSRRNKLGNSLNIRNLVKDFEHVFHVQAWLTKPIQNMTATQIEIATALKNEGYMFRPSRSADFIDRLCAKEQPEAYELSESQREWLFALLHRYRKHLKGLHFEHCKDPLCRYQMEGKLKKQLTQLCLF